MEGIFVIAIEDNEVITFSTTEPNNAKCSTLALNLSQGNGLMDRAIVRFDNGSQLPKLQFNRNSTKLYIPMDDEDFAVVRCEEIGEMPVNFKAESNGTYSLSLGMDNVEFAYLHLIDNLTGSRPAQDPELQLRGQDDGLRVPLQAGVCHGRQQQ